MDDQRARAIQAVRDAVAAFGGPGLSAWSDDDIERSVLRMAEVVGGAGLTVEEASRGLQWLSRPVASPPATP